MDPITIMEENRKLNLDLMTWRMAPNLKTSLMADKRFLLVGAGTLGCAVARNLLSWGVTKLTLLDCGKVDYSNPTRQSLFTFQDAVDNRLKAEAATDALKAISPSLDVTGVAMRIPTQGSVGNPEAAREDILALSNLVKGHDCVFLLTDTRESR